MLTLAVCPMRGGWFEGIVYRGRVKIALMDSGIGLLPAAAAVRRLRPDADLVLSWDPDGMPWGPRTPEDITQRALDVAGAAAFGFNPVWVNRLGLPDEYPGLDPVLTVTSIAGIV